MRRWNNNDDFLACEPSFGGNISGEKLQEGKNNGFLSDETTYINLGDEMSGSSGNAFSINTSCNSINSYTSSASI